MRSPPARAARSGLATCLALALGLGEAHAGAQGLRLFPADPSLVPLGVGAAFAAPAVIALIWLSFRRLLRLAGRLAVFGLAAATVLAATEAAVPGTVREPAGWLLQRWLT